MLNRRVARQVHMLKEAHAIQRKIVRGGKIEQSDKILLRQVQAMLKQQKAPQTER